MATGKQDATAQSAKYRFRVAFSFPGEHRAYVEKVDGFLTARLGADAVFYDNRYKHELARPDLDIYLQHIYADNADLMVVFVGGDYARKEWCGVEWSAIRDAIKRHRGDAVMFFRFDDEPVPGMLSIHGYIDARRTNEQEAADLILKRLALNDGYLVSAHPQTSLRGAEGRSVPDTTREAGEMLPELSEHLPMSILLNALLSWATKKGLDQLVSALFPSKPAQRLFRQAFADAIRDDDYLRDRCDSVPEVDLEAFASIPFEELVGKWRLSDPKGLAELLISREVLILPGFDWTRSDIELLAERAHARINRSVLESLRGNQSALQEVLVYYSQQAAVEHQELIKVDQEILRVVRQEGEKTRDAIRQVQPSSAESDLRGGAADLGPSGIGLPRERLLLESLRSTRDELRKFLDARGESLFAELESAIRSRTWTVAKRNAEELTQFLEKEGPGISPHVHGRALILLADLAIIEGWLTGEIAASVPRARAHYDRAITTFGDSPSDDDCARLLAFRAKLMFCERGADAALEILQDCDDPRSIGSKLAILLEAGRIQEALGIIRGRELHSRWCSAAVAAYIESGERDAAKHVLGWARTNAHNEYRDCIVTYASSAFRLLVRNRGTGIGLTPYSLNERERDELMELTACLEDIIDSEATAGQPPSGLLVEALSLACTIAHLLRNEDAAKKHATPLEAVVPLPLVYARGVVRGDIPFAASLISRLRAEYPESFDALALACILQSEHTPDRRDAFEQAKNLVRWAKAAEDKEHLVRLLYELSQGLTPAERSQTRECAAQVLEPTHRLLVLLEADEALRTGQLDQAEQLLNALSAETDLFWLQLDAEVKRKRGDLRGSADQLRKAAGVFRAPDLLRQLARTSMDAKDIESAIEVLEELVGYDPDNVEYLVWLSQAYHQTGRNGKAAERLNVLRRLQPEESVHALNLASCLALDGDRPGALEVLEKLCRGDTVPVRVLLGRAQLLHAAGRPERAFDSLHEVRSRHWEDAHFLLAYVSLGYAAQREAEAQEGFCHLLELHKQGRVPEGMLWEQSAADLPAFVQERRQGHDYQNQLLISGRIPWPMVDSVRGLPFRAAWYYRTQDCVPPDDPSSRADFTLYASHGMLGMRDGAGSLHLAPMRSSPPGRPVVADASAIITLHELGLLDRTAELFGSLLLPSSYRAQWRIDDSTRLQPHQPSRRHAARFICEAADDGRLNILDGDLEAHSDRVPIVLEDGQDGVCPDGRYGIRDLAEWMKGKGLLGQRKWKDLVSLTRHPAAGPADRFAEQCESAGVLMDATTLRLLAEVHVLGQLLRAARIHIPEHELRAVRRELASFDFDARARERHESMCDDLDANARFMFVDVVVPGDDRAALPVRLDMPLAALALAGQQSAPLLADDRVLQVCALNAHRNAPGVAFGTAQVLQQLRCANFIDDGRLRDGFLSLIRWRYRFIVVPAEVLYTFAVDYRENPPGEPLREIARYAHECMRDPGLLAGKEPTEPPMSVAMGLWMEWARTIARFLSLLWIDEQLPETLVLRLTEWAVARFLPRPPHNIGRHGQHVLCEMLPALVMDELLTKDIIGDHRSRVNKALQCVASAFGLSPEEYVQVVAEMMDVLSGNPVRR